MPANSARHHHPVLEKQKTLFIQVILIQLYNTLLCILSQKICF